MLCGAPLWAQGTVSGVVVNSVTRQPIARVLVESPGGGAGVLTDNAGRFSFAGVSPGATQLRFRRPGYFDPRTGQMEASTTVAVSAETPEQTLVLEPSASLRGQVALGDGELPAGIRVTLLREHVAAGWRRWQRQENATVRADGSFAFEDLQPGRYLLHAEASLDPVPADAPPGMRSGYPPVYAPDASDAGEASVFALGPGQSGDAQLRLRRVPFYPVKVRVTGDAQGRFQVNGNGFTDWAARYSREDGTVTAELPSGNYLLTGRSYGRDPATGELPLHVAGAALSKQTLTLSAQGRLTVESAGEGGSGPKAGQSVMLMLVPVDPGASQLTLSLPLGDEAGANVPQPEIAPGKYWVSAVEGGSAGYVAALSSGGVDLFSEPLEVLPGVSPTLSVTVRQDPGEIAVTRAGGALAQSCFLQVVPLSPGGVGRSVAMEDTGASVQVPGLPPGEYLLLATMSREEIPYREPGVVQQLRGTRVTVTAGGSAQATVAGVFAGAL